MTEPDLSLALSRTALAWRRTGLGFAAVALVTARHGLHGEATGLVLLALACLAAAAGLGLAWVRSGARGRRRLGHGGDMLIGTSVALTTAFSTVVGVLIGR